MKLLKFKARMRNLKGINLNVNDGEANPFKRRGRTPAFINNTLMGKMFKSTIERVDKDLDGNCTPLEDVLDSIIVGVIRSFDIASTHKGNKLNLSVLKVIFNEMEVITAKGIAHKFNYKDRQSRNYMTACKLVDLYYKRYLNKINPLSIYS